MDKIEIIKNFVDKHCAIKQRDDNWYKLIGKTIGGSEIATLLGENPYKSKESLIEQKIQIANGDNVWENIFNCNWGIVFEDIIAEFTKRKYNIEIYGDEISVIDGNVRYSPDGIALIDNQITLLEFKCPTTRKIKFNGKVPKQYEKQVQCGMCVVDIVERGLYIEGTFKICEYTDLDFTTNYNLNFHGYVKYNNPPLVVGILIIYGSDVLLQKKYKTQIIDFGAAERSDIEYIFGAKLPMKSFMWTENIDLTNIFDHDTENILGMIPWKLMEYNTVDVYKDDSFMVSIRPIIDETMNNILIKDRK
jgi:putative phage-type endonuclease